MSKKGKRIRYPKIKTEEKEQNEQKVKNEEQEEKKLHFVLEVHDGSLSNDSEIGK